MEVRIRNVDEKIVREIDRRVLLQSFKSTIK